MKWLNMENTHRNSNSGFTLMLATLIASLMSSLGIAMFTIAQKEVALSTIGRDSQFAFYAADLGAECALYWDYVYDLFATTTVSTMADRDGDPATTGDRVQPMCDEQVLAEWVNNPDSTPEVSGDPSYGGFLASNQGITRFKFDVQGANLDAIGNPREYCAYVTVTKWDSDLHGGNWNTKIDSLGYNVPCSVLDSGNVPDKALERAVQITR
jgi:Tfp pilus assembly protein PilX